MFEISSVSNIRFTLYFIDALASTNGNHHTIYETRTGKHTRLTINHRNITDAQFHGRSQMKRGENLVYVAERGHGMYGRLGEMDP